MKSFSLLKDWNCCVYISPPTSSFQKTLPTSVAFALEHSDYIDWSKPFVFVCVDLHISEFLMKHNIYKLGNITKIYPCNIFYMSPEDALKLDTSAPSTKVTLAPLDKTTGVEFLHNQWSHSMPGTKQFIQKTVENHISGCVYLPCDPSEDSVSNPVSAGVVPASGLLSCLVTDPSHRRKGYASLVTKFIFKQMASQGYHPCLDADISNQAANKLYHSIPGSRNIAQVHFVCHKVLWSRNKFDRQGYFWFYILNSKLYTVSSEFDRFDSIVIIKNNFLHAFPSFCVCTCQLSVIIWKQLIYFSSFIVNMHTSLRRKLFSSEGHHATVERNMTLSVVKPFHNSLLLHVSFHLNMLQ